MSVTVMGTELDGDVRGWRNDQRRVAGVLALAVAVVVLAVDLIAYFAAGHALAWLDWTLVLVLVAVLAFILVLMFAKPRPVVDAEAHLGPAAPATLAEATAEPAPGESAPAPYVAPAPVAAPAPPPPPAHDPNAITLRCGDCGTIFDVHDSGQRPLYHTCPGCGAEGVLKDAPMMTPPTTPAPPPAAPPRAAAPPAPAPPPAPATGGPALRKLKLRCGNCKQVFAIEDTGERPLRRPCPYCARMGEIR